VKAILKLAILLIAVTHLRLNPFTLKNFSSHIFPMCQHNSIVFLTLLSSHNLLRWQSNWALLTRRSAEKTVEQCPIKVEIYFSSRDQNPLKMYHFSTACYACPPKLKILSSYPARTQHSITFHTLLTIGPCKTVLPPCKKTDTQKLVSTGGFRVSFFTVDNLQGASILHSRI
jgi:hypothetical protein